MYLPHDPQIFLAVDNCFASKRWTAAAEWLEIARTVGLACVEASADNECDPFFTTPEYLADWKNEVRIHSRRLGVRVSSVYSGHGSYATLGLAHTDARIRAHLLNDWLKTMLKTASDLDAGLGFFCHAFADSVLQEPKAYQDALRDLARSLADLSTADTVSGTGFLAVEQMYSPHQVPWTISGAEELIREVYRQTMHSSSASGRACYITIDTGHAGAQRRFVRPGRQRLLGLIAAYREGRRVDNLWLGPRTAYALFDDATARESGNDTGYIEQIEREMGKFPYLFAEDGDGDTYAWLERLGRYSPIIHLQQTSGKSSAHLPFTAEHNRIGIIQGDKVLEALGVSCSAESEAEMPPGCGEIFLTIEMFSGTADMNVDILHRLRESVAYWRRFVPQDGLLLSELLDGLARDGGLHVAH